MHVAYEHSHTKCGCKGTTYLENGQLFSFFSRFSYNIQSIRTLRVIQRNAQSNPVERMKRSNETLLVIHWNAF